LKSGRYRIQFNAFPNNNANTINFHIGPTNPPPRVGRTTQSGGTALSTACLDNIFVVSAGDYLVCG
jgi:hypothetical protein